MLLPSAIPCSENRARPTLSHFPAFTLATPPYSPPSSSHFSSNIFSASRKLQSFLGVQPPPNSQLNVPTRSRSHLPSKKVEKRRPTVARNPNKRRRSAFEDNDQENIPTGDPSTPKRQRVAPPVIPLGLERRDFYALQPLPTQTFNFQFSISSENPFAKHMSTMEMSPPPSHEENAMPDVDEESEENWNSEDDNDLVELVLEKLRLSKKEWEECAKILKTDGPSLGRRWKELVGDGEVGLKFRRNRRAHRADVRGVWENRTESTLLPPLSLGS